jgi:uncharacterized membrane protein YbhN (UPF0104 family)
LKHLNFILKTLLIIVILGLIYHQLSALDLNAFRVKIISNLTSGNYFWYILVMLLMMPFNWWLESIKWQILMSPFETISRRKSLNTILAGVAAGIVTPARLGEYAGRLITSDPDKKGEVVAATFLGSIAQNLCNITGGLLFSYYFLKNYFHVTYLDSATFFVVILIHIMVLWLIYYQLPKVVTKLGRFEKLAPYINKVAHINLYSRPILNRVLILSLCRYLVYFGQYFLVMKFLGQSAESISVMANIAMIYLIQTGIPLPAFISVFARGELAVLIWASLRIDALTALTATFILWTVNLIFPSLVGLWIIYKTDISKFLKKV